MIPLRSSSFTAVACDLELCGGGERVNTGSSTLVVSQFKWYLGSSLIPDPKTKLAKEWK